MDALPPSPPGGPFRRVVARDGLAVLLGVSATVVVELGVYLAAIAAGSPPLHAALATLAAAVLWLALAAPPLAASGATALARFLRAGCLADASVVTLIVLWLACPQVTLGAAAKIYCVLVAMAMLAVAVTGLGRSSAARFVLAVVTAAVLMASLASPFWVGGAARAASREGARTALAVAVYVNPFYAVTAAIAQQARFVWQQHGNVMYARVARGYYSSAPVARWYASVLIHLSVAALLVAAGWLTRRRARQEAP